MRASPVRGGQRNRIGLTEGRPSRARLAAAACLMLLCCSLVAPPQVLGETAADTERRPLPLIELPVPESEADRSYLGLSGRGTFTLDQIKAPLLLIEVFSFYCPHCHNLAPRVNEVYKAIEARPDLKDMLKMVGIGIGNSTYEVKLFRERFHTPFPCFADQDMRNSLILGVRGTPTFIGARKDENGRFRRVFFRPGAFSDAAQFLADLLRAAGSE